MSEPTAIPPPQPQPFHPAAVARSGKGCSKPLLFGCAALLVLLGLGMVFFVVKMPDILPWAFQQWETQIMERLPADASPAEKERLHQAFSAAIRAMRNPQAVDPAKLREVQVQVTQVLEMGRSQSKLSHEDLARLTAALESLGGVKPVPPRVEPTPPTSDAEPSTSDAAPGDEGDDDADEPPKPPTKTV